MLSIPVNLTILINYVKGIISNMDVDTKDHSYQYHFREYPEVPRPVIAASWESSSYESVDVIMELNPNTRVLWTPGPESTNPPKPVFFQVRPIMCSTV